MLLLERPRTYNSYTAASYEERRQNGRSGRKRRHYLRPHQARRYKPEQLLLCARVPLRQYHSAGDIAFSGTAAQHVARTQDANNIAQPTILRDLGWTATKAQLYSVPPYACACVVAIAVASVSDRTKQRGIYLAIFALPAIAGFCIMLWSTNPNTRYGGIFLVTVGSFPGGPGFLAWAANNAARSADRAVSMACVVTLGTAGGILATWSVNLMHRLPSVSS